VVSFRDTPVYITKKENHSINLALIVESQMFGTLELFKKLFFVLDKSNQQSLITIGELCLHILCLSLRLEIITSQWLISQNENVHHLLNLIVAKGKAMNDYQELGNTFLQF